MSTHFSCFFIFYDISWIHNRKGDYMRKSSLDAYTKVDKVTMRDRVLAEVKASKEYGMTNLEACKALRKPPNSIAPRLGELHESGDIVRLREVRLNPNTKCYQNVYVLPQYVGDRPTEQPLKQKSKRMEEILEHIRGKAERKGSYTIVWTDEIYDMINEVLK